MESTAAVIVLVFYCYSSLCLMRIAQKLDISDAFLAWIPLLNLSLLFRAADKPVWWIVLLCIPIVNLIVLIITFMSLCEQMGYPSGIGLLILVPLGNFILLGYLAFAPDTGQRISNQDKIRSIYGTEQHTKGPNPGEISARPTRVICGSCSEAFIVESLQKGTVVQCPHCKRKVRVPIARVLSG
ncbi:MAG: DUF5684 domain-containing protein [Deltaproteobacteria bacterium]